MITLLEYLTKHKIDIDENTVVEVHLPNNPDYAQFKDTDAFPGFTAEEVSIDLQSRLVLSTEFSFDVVNKIKIPLAHKGHDDDGFVTGINQETVRLVFLVTL